MQTPLRAVATGQTRVLLVDDQEEFLDFAGPMLNEHPDLAVVGQASSGEMALKKISKLKPDVVICDVQMPGLSGFQAARKFLATRPEVRVIMVSADDDPRYESMARRAGAIGFVSKLDLMPETILATMEEAEDDLL